MMRHKKLLFGVCAVFALVLVLGGCRGASAGKSAGDSTGKPVSEDVAGSASDDTAQSDGEDLVIPVSEVSSTAKFYPVDLDGIDMEVIAVKDADGNIRTAFNTCQICYSSGRGYYEQSGDKLICQNCGNQFGVNQVEVESGGCNPWPIFAENKVVTDDTITVPFEFLKESKEIFSNWKTSY